MQTMIDLSVMMSEPATENWIQIMKTGEFQHPVHGRLQISPTDLHRFKDNFDKKVRGVDIAVDVAHEPDKGAVAWFKELKVEGDKLMAKVSWTPEGKDLIKSGKYRYFSPEFMFQYKDAESGKQFKDVLLGGAITNRPFLKGMEPIAFSETGMANVWMAEDEPYDPDHDGDDDSTTDPKKNPDWMLDVMSGDTPWPTDPKQQEELRKVGATQPGCNFAFQMKQRQLKKAGKPTDPKTKMDDDLFGFQFGDDVTNSHKTPPKGKPQSRADYADPDNYKYPIDKDHIKAAVSYFNHDGMQEKGGYSEEQWAKIGKRIASAANEHLGKGYSFDGGKIKTPDEGKSTKASDPDATPHPTDDADAGKFKDKKGGTKMSEQTPSISLAEYKAMQDEVKALKEQNRRIALDEKVKGFMFNESTKKGKIAPAQHDAVLDLMMGMNEEQITKFEEVMNALPAAISFNDEKGFGNAGQAKDRDTLVTEMADKFLKEGKAQDYRAAILMAEEEVPESIK